MRINRLFPIFCVSEVTVRNEKHRLPAAEVVKGKGRISRQAVALLSVLGLAFSSLLAVVPMTAPAVEQGGAKSAATSAAGASRNSKVAAGSANKGNGQTSGQLDFREAGSVAGAAGRASGPLRGGCPQLTTVSLLMERSSPA